MQTVSKMLRWYQRAIDLNVSGKGEERPAAWIAAILKYEEEADRRHW
jgi:hypothetical protein